MFCLEQQTLIASGMNVGTKSKTMLIVIGVLSAAVIIACVVLATLFFKWRSKKQAGKAGSIALTDVKKLNIDPDISSQRFRGFSSGGSAVPLLHDGRICSNSDSKLIFGDLNGKSIFHLISLSGHPTCFNNISVLYMELYFNFWLYVCLGGELLPNQSPKSIIIKSVNYNSFLGMGMSLYISL